MDFEGVGPGRQAGHDVELSEEPGHDFTGICLLRELFEVGHDALERLLDPADCLFGKIFTLRVQALLMLKKFFAVEIDQGRRQK